ncbi:hypothetical protein HMPREF0022_03065 [Acinetobacter baumannii 6014059]|uniref:Uncharacterized protein n=1 Tax=Acinetobacter baumannii 6014059 TaxID=525242 RepID=A0A828SR96_ACIBA|nr:hypothetical protein HMPREF0022_03065 [Acinetobacter baumannii 6014059]
MYTNHGIAYFYFSFLHKKQHVNMLFYSICGMDINHPPQQNSIFML